jgi:hypothetical protein
MQANEWQQDGVETGLQAGLELATLPLQEGHGQRTRTVNPR